MASLNFDKFARSSAPPKTSKIGKCPRSLNQGNTVLRFEAVLCAVYITGALLHPVRML